jgi:hypothetical protein
MLNGCFVTSGPRISDEREDTGAAAENQVRRQELGRPLGAIAVKRKRPPEADVSLMH